MAETNVLRFPTNRKRAYNPHYHGVAVADFPPNVQVIPRPRQEASAPQIAPDFPSRQLLSAMLATLEPGHAARMFRHFELARAIRPDDQALADAGWWLAVIRLAAEDERGR